MEEGNDPDNKMASSQTSIFNLQSSKDKPKQHFLKCIGNNDAILMCLNHQCKQTHVFQCSKQDCKCQQFHESCQKGNSKLVMKIVNSKILNVNPFVVVINQIIDKKIDQLSELKEKLIVTAEREFEYIDLNLFDKKFLSLMNGEMKIEQFTSRESKIIWDLSNMKDLTQNNKVSTKIRPLLERFDEQFTKRIKESIDQLNKSINSLIDEKKNYQQKYIQQRDIINRIQQFSLGLMHKARTMSATELLQFQIMDSITRLQPEVIKKSNICTTEEQAQKFIRIFRKNIKTYLICFVRVRTSSVSRNTFKCAARWKKQQLSPKQTRTKSSADTLLYYMITRIINSQKILQESPSFFHSQIIKSSSQKINLKQFTDRQKKIKFVLDRINSVLVINQIQFLTIVQM